MLQRPTRIKIKAQDVDGKTVRLTLEGFEARVFQHEFDHLDGVLMHDRFDAPSLEAARPGLVQLEDTFVQANPGVEVQRLAPAPVLH